MVTAVVVVVLAGLGTALGLWLTRSQGSAQPASRSARDPSRFQVRAVLAMGAAPCAAGQFPGRPSSAGPAACYTLGPVALDGRDVAGADTSTQSADGVGIDLALTAAGLDKFNALAASGYGRPSPQNQVALVVDGTVQSAPQFNTSHFDNNGVRISGNFTDAEARRVAAIIAAPTPTTTSPTFAARPGTIADPCRYLTSDDARILLGSAVTRDTDAPDRNSTCHYVRTQPTPVSGVTIDVTVNPSLSVQLWHGRIPLLAGSPCPECLAMTVRPISGIGDRAAWYQLAPKYQTGPFTGGNLDVQVGTTAVRISVDSVANAQAIAEAAAHLLVPRLTG